MTNKDAFDVSAARARCRQHRRRILDISQTVSALHIAPAFSCMEIVDTIYYGLMRRDRGPNADDSFIISKGHGSLAQYAVLESLGIVSKAELDLYGKPGGRFATHPDYGLPGIEASTGSLECIPTFILFSTRCAPSDGKLCRWTAMIPLRFTRQSRIVPGRSLLC